MRKRNATWNVSFGGYGEAGTAAGWKKRFPPKESWIHPAGTSTVKRLIGSM
jgi:hypothetical protein